jgi:hypothetical protein
LKTGEPGDGEEVGWVLVVRVRLEAAGVEDSMSRAMAAGRTGYEKVFIMIGIGRS